jgi:hypothetical protein
MECFPFAFLGLFWNGYLWFLMAKLPRHPRRWMAIVGTLLSLLVTAVMATIAIMF